MGQMNVDSILHLNTKNNFGSYHSVDYNNALDCVIHSQAVGVIGRLVHSSPNTRRISSH